MADMRNFVNLVGHLGKDAEVRTFTVRNPETGESETRQNVEISLCTNSLKQPVFHTVVGYADHHVRMIGLMKKGEKLMVTGYIWYDADEKDGVKSIFPKIIIDSFEIMMAPKADASNRTGTSAKLH